MLCSEARCPASHEGATLDTPRHAVMGMALGCKGRGRVPDANVWFGLPCDGMLCMHIGGQQYLRTTFDFFNLHVPTLCKGVVQ